MRAPARHDAARDGGGRDTAAARSARAGQSGLSHIIVLARVITRLGSLPDVDTQVVEACSLPTSSNCAGSTKTMNALEEPERAGRPCRKRRRPEAGRPSRHGGSMMAYPVAELYGEMAFIAAHFHWSRESLLQMEHGERRRWCRRSSPSTVLDLMGAAPTIRSPGFEPRCASTPIRASASWSLSTRSSGGLQGEGPAARTKRGVVPRGRRQRFERKLVTFTGYPNLVLERGLRRPLPQGSAEEGARLHRAHAAAAQPNGAR